MTDFVTLLEVLREWDQLSDRVKKTTLAVLADDAPVADQRSVELSQALWFVGRVWNRTGEGEFRDGVSIALAILSDRADVVETPPIDALL